jgi:hypothetical protein
MLNKQTCQIVNTTTNTMYQVFENKTDHYKFLHYVIPRERFKRIDYIKKNKKKLENNDEITDSVTRLAKNLQLSKRETKMYINQLEQL